MVTGTERGNSYRIWQDATHVRIYESANNVATLRAWTDPSAIKSGAYVSLRTDGANVLFDNLTFTRESKYYYAGGQRVAVRHNASTAVN